MTLAFELSKHNKKCVYKAMYKKWKQTKNKDIWKKILQFRTNSACILKKKKKGYLQHIVFFLLPFRMLT